MERRWEDAGERMEGRMEREREDPTDGAEMEIHKERSWLTQRRETGRDARGMETTRDWLRQRGREGRDGQGQKRRKVWQAGKTDREKETELLEADRGMERLRDSERQREEGQPERWGRGGRRWTCREGPGGTHRWRDICWGELRTYRERQRQRREIILGVADPKLMSVSPAP